MEKKRTLWRSALAAVLFFSVCCVSYAQVQPYTIYKASEGRQVTFEEMLAQLQDAPLVFFGEFHNNSILHWLQLQVLKGLQTERLVLAAEFFERDDQLTLDEWLAGKLSDANLEAETKLWNNFKVDYKPLLQYAKAKEIPFIASNVPRKYASYVSREGLEALETLSEKAKAYLPELPIQVDMELPSYAAMQEMMHGAGSRAAYMVQAQALKDATMAESLFPALEQGKQVLHINGAYHTKDGEGIVWYVREKMPDLPILLISCVEQEDIHAWDATHAGLADYVVVLPLDSPKSY
ncbi:ChaN family lipoprotein [Nitritalea halalkaliphila]|nr:ChaN family lipoprotein [Nitritalea halalkaliphila]